MTVQEVNSNTKIVVRRQWNDYRQVEVAMGNISNLRWDRLSGGVRTRSPRPMIHGYVNCQDIEGDIAHSGAHGPHPHSIKICIVKKDNNPKVYETLRQIVGEKPEG